MHRAAARLIAVGLSRQRLGATIGIWPPRDRLALDIGSQILTLEEAQFVVRSEVLGLETRSPLQADDFHPRLAKLGGEDAAGGADADNDDVGLLDRHGSSPP